MRRAERSVTDLLGEAAEKLRARPERYAGLTATYQFVITGANGGDWYLRFADGVLDLVAGRAARPDVVASISDRDYVALRTGRLTGPRALTSGRLRVQGDEEAVMRMAELLARPGA